MRWKKTLSISHFSSSSRTTTRPFAGRATPGRCLAVFRPSHGMNFVCDCETNQTLYTPTAPEEMRPHFTFRRERQGRGRFALINNRKREEEEVTLPHSLLLRGGPLLLGVDSSATLLVARDWRSDTSDFAPLLDELADAEGERVLFTISCPMELREMTAVCWSSSIAPLSGLNSEDF